MQRGIYLIKIGKNDEFLEDEYGNLLFFDTLQQIADYCIYAGISFDEVRYAQVSIEEVAKDESN